VTTAAALLIPPLSTLPKSPTPTPIPGFQRLSLPDHDQYGWRKQHAGGVPEAAYYHPHTVIHVHGNGIAEMLPPNPVAWTLACAWSDQHLPYPLAGPVLITGTENSHGTFIPLPAALAAQTERITTAATGWWLDHLHLLFDWPLSPASPDYAPAIALARDAM